MAKQAMIQREIKRQKLNKKFQKQRYEIKKNLKQVTEFEDYMRIQKRLQNLPKNSAKCRIKNRCWVTGRSRGFYRDFGLCRHMIREMSHNCVLPGIRKASW